VLRDGVHVPEVLLELELVADRRRARRGMDEIDRRGCAHDGMGGRELHLQLPLPGERRALDRRVPVFLERGIQVGPGRAERGFSFGHLALDDLSLAERRAHIRRGLGPG